ncbi:conserved hypothetical protein [Leishmania major strain Friedlin]|uniref:Uncharacterized protein n=1 Tax=Leishmania major TaxID=5664 RepID=Q4Q3V6_LEIMA|nr:conserved hypothetical protein [Leishmania major strain Friedlin]CAG9580846.1 hypothetical_protein_-_conserved [Leishmania major strain Friedlin]CAJ06623.1 conserved hypothetical protein [Leishmania major strain Friedlin]|eukprot:XP_001685992.1 conserved hypothetical protein [Leishmania major strain Friedlin]
MRKTVSMRVAPGGAAEATRAWAQATLNAVAIPPVPRGTHYSLFLQRHHRALGLHSCGEGAGSRFQALRCSRAFIKSRSLSPDDPFGERSTWEDPSDGIYAAWKDVDQEAFVNATESQEVRQAHFGPEWARFSTVGRMSVKKMREEQTLQHAPPSGAADSESQDAGVAAAASGSLTQRYPTAEELHEADLRQRRRLLERNYSSYETFLEHEVGRGEEFAEAEEGLAFASEAGGHRGDAQVELYSAASMESAFSSVEGLDGLDRMAQRNVEREARETLEAAEVAERVPLPPFMFEPDTRDVAAAPALSSSNLTPTTSSASTATEIRRSKTATNMSAVKPCSTSGSPSKSASPSTSAVAGGIPASVVRQVLGALGNPHGDSRLPLTDPLHWGTEDIIRFLTLMEQPPISVDAGDWPASSAWSAMDDTMCDTFRMACVTGETLLNVVRPPRLFRLMRQWHIRRHDVLSKAWKLRVQAEGALATEADSRLPADGVQMTVEQNRERLAEAVQQLDRNLIHETILLCFPYGH